MIAGAASGGGSLDTGTLVALFAAVVAFAAAMITLLVSLLRRQIDASSEAHARQIAQAQSSIERQIDQQTHALERLSDKTDERNQKLHELVSLMRSDIDQLDSRLRDLERDADPWRTQPRGTTSVVATMQHGADARACERPQQHEDLARSPTARMRTPQTSPAASAPMGGSSQRREAVAKTVGWKLATAGDVCGVGDESRPM